MSIPPKRVILRVMPQDEPGRDWSFSRQEADLRAQVAAEGGQVIRVFIDTRDSPEAIRAIDDEIERMLREREADYLRFLLPGPPECRIDIP